MIEARGLTRTYGGTAAVQGIDLHVGPGEVVGFLGPNGAGKTTTLRMLAGTLAPTAGTARIGGHDVVEAPREARRLVGYLPERPPLYDDMSVHGHVRFAAELHGVADPDAAADAALERTGLGHVPHRIVGHLSKGYRQRVGLAQALVHAPRVLLLDEPSSGLDPAQRVEVRELVRELSHGDVTVLLSTHVLPEIEQLCERVVIVAGGRIVTEGRLDDLRAGHDLLVEVGSTADARDAVAHVPGVLGVEALGPGQLRVRADADVRAAVARALAPHDLLALRSAGGLEEVFLAATRGSP